jgi:nucleoside diphosphate kinase
VKTTYSAYLIKPRGMDHRSEIRSLIQQFGLEIISFHSVIVSLEQVRLLYPAAQGIVFKAICCELEDEECEIGLVANYRNERHAIEKLASAIGRSTRPSECTPDSVRHRFGDHEPQLISGTVTYWYNAAHCARNEHEFATMRRAFGLTLPDHGNDGGQSPIG